MGLLDRSEVTPVSRTQSYIGVAVGLAILIILPFRGNLTDQIDAVYEPPPPQAILDQSKMKFEEVAHSVGLNTHFKPYFPNPEVRASDRDLTLLMLHPSVSVVDINGDGYMDLYVSSGSNAPNQLFVNKGGKSFEDQAEAYHIGDINKDFQTGPVVFADFNGDGKLDLVASKSGCHQFFLGQGPGKPFVEHSEWLNGYCSNAHAINVLDYNHDGKLDIVFGNYFENVDLRKKMPHTMLWGAQNDKMSGGQNELFENTGSGFKSAMLFPSKAFTQSIGVMNVAKTGGPDLIFGNDYSSDELWRNHKDRGFVDETDHYIPIRYHGHAGMNSEVMDFDQDGLADIYVSNIYKPPYNNQANLLWKNTGDGFVQVSQEMGVAKCGFSWGAKFADFDLDGNLDLMVVNGRAHSEAISTPKDGRSYWHERTVIGQTPLFMRRFFGEHHSKGSEHIYVSAFEHSCLFEQKDGHFYDVALHAGITDLQDGKGLALIDYDNDGKMDFAVTNTGGDLLLYHNVTKTDGHWLGVALEDKNGSSIPIGTSVKVYLEGRDAPLVRYEYPNNGYASQSDPRFVFGLGQTMKPVRMVLHWESGLKEEFKDLKLDQYTKFKEGTGKKL